MMRAHGLEPNRHHCTDCLEGMSLLEDGCIDVIVTSPPYNIGVRYSRHDDDMPREAYLDWIERVVLECRRVLRDDGSLFLNIGAKPSDQVLQFEVLGRAVRHLVLQNTIVWVKSVALDHVGAFGHYKPVNSHRYLSSCHELVLHLTKRGDVRTDKAAVAVPYQDPANATRWWNGGDGLRDRGTTWFIPYPTVKEARGHPCVFPVELPSRCIRFHGLRRGMLVLDPFMGSGSTAVAAAELGVDCIGFEIDNGYVKDFNEHISLHPEYSQIQFIWQYFDDPHKYYPE
jgi:site-specific DNA-methyltransferase (adenine-specific)